MVAALLVMGVGFLLHTDPLVIDMVFYRDVLPLAVIVSDFNSTSYIKLVQ